MFRCIVKTIYLEKLKRLIIWTGGRTTVTVIAKLKKTIRKGKAAEEREQEEKRACWQH